MHRIAVGDVMTRKFVSANSNSTLKDCIKIMAKERVNSLPIIKRTKLLGILTARDILWVLNKKPTIKLESIKAIDIATKKVAVIKPSADIHQALKKMRMLNFRRLPVLSKGELIGMITLKDIFAVESSIYTEVKSFMDIREEEQKLKQIKANWPLEGMCDNCGAFSELLKVEGNLLCQDCREEIY